MNDTVKELLIGSYDLHMHTAPSHAPRKLDDWDAMQMANKYGMAGILLKNHYESTAGRAWLLNNHNVFSTRAIGGIALNWPAGGLNPYAVESCLVMGGRMVWMPTRDSQNSLQFGNMLGDFFERPGISIYNKNGKIRTEVYEILEVVKKYNACIATGHLSFKESIDLCKAARSLNIKTVLTHPNWIRTLVPLNVQKELAADGVYIEKVYANIKEGTVTEEQMVAEMHEIGTEHVFLVTDRGQASEDFPVIEFAAYIEMLLLHGIAKTEIQQMCKQVPEFLISNGC